jgi:hypothetical protein
MNLAEQIRATLIAAQPENSDLEEEDINMMTNMILSTLSRNKLITEERCLEMQIPSPDKVVSLTLYGELWKLLVPQDPTRTIPLEALNRPLEENEE